MFNNKSFRNMIADLTSGTYASSARNRKIADLFREAVVIEKYGSGMQRITNAFVACGLVVPLIQVIDKSILPLKKEKFGKY